MTQSADRELFYMLILAGDNIYEMDYSIMLADHIRPPEPANSWWPAPYPRTWLKSVAPWKARGVKV